jgi:hypothetical protein
MTKNIIDQNGAPGMVVTLKLKIITLKLFKIIA